MLYIKLFIEREKNIGQSAPECPFNAWCQRCNMPGVVNTVAGGPRPPFRKLWHIAGNVYDKKPQRYAKDNRTG